MKQGREPVLVATYPIHAFRSTFWPSQIATDRKNAFSSLKSTHRYFRYGMVYFSVRASLRLGGGASKSVFFVLLNAKVNPEPSNHHRSAMSTFEHVKLGRGETGDGLG